MFTDEEILKVASLARINIGPGELAALSRDFNAILSYVRKLEEVDVSEVQAMSHVHKATNILREDEVTDSLGPEESLENAPDTHNGFFRVPIIIE